MRRGLIISIITGTLLALSGTPALASSKTPAHAAVTDICDENGYCLNAWNGGPLVKAYFEGNTHEQFSLTSSCDFNLCIQYNGGDFVGDYQNNLGDAKAGLNGDGAWGGSWQQMFPSDCPADWYKLYNNHWEGYLSFGNSNGSQVYLNASEANGNCLIGG